MNYLFALVAGIVQGLTEFLPVSSTGHLIILERLFGVSSADFGLAFDASIHLGTLGAVLLFFWRDYLGLVRNRKLLIRLLIGTVPAGFFGVLLESRIESSFRELWVVGLMLIFFSVVMYVAEKVGKKRRASGSMTKRESLVVGLFQALALIPGVSRSGSTISGGLFLGFSREEAARFAFLLSGPIVAAAGLLKMVEVFSSAGVRNGSLPYFGIGIISSGVAGFLTIKYFLRFISRHSWYPFLWYRVLLGVLLIVLSYIV